MSLHRAQARRALAVALLASLGLAGGGSVLRAQDHDHMGGMSPSRAANADLHMEMSPSRPATAADSSRAAAITAQLRTALAQYMDTTAAVKDGYKMFMPQVKEQKVYHFTNNWRAVQEAFRFDPEKPTSLLYKKKPDGQFVLVGAMYTAPKRFGADKLDARVPTSIARWHKHVNWCLPKKGDAERWLERKDGMPVFGPESPIATERACDAVGGTFHDTIFGWMVHANVFEGDDPATIWGDEHAGHDMHAGMKMGAP
jgi:hypothetical protein